MAPGKRQTQSLHQKVVEELTRRIASGDLLPGTLLPTEHQFASEFGVSRVVVRESVKVLVEKGLVEVRQGRGTTVRPETDWNPFDPLILRFRQQDLGTGKLRAELVEARRVFEVQIAGMAATRISDEELDHLRAHLQYMDSLTDTDAYNKADVEFHMMIARASQNRVLAKLIEPIRELLWDAFRLTIALPGGPRVGQVFHWRIFRALNDHDPTAAEEAMRDHLDNAAKDLYSVLQAQRDSRDPVGARVG